VSHTPKPAAHEPVTGAIVRWRRRRQPPRPSGSTWRGLTLADWRLLVVVAAAQVVAASRREPHSSCDAVHDQGIRRAHHLGDRGDRAAAWSPQQLLDSSACGRTPDRLEGGADVPHDRGQAYGGYDRRTCLARARRSRRHRRDGRRVPSARSLEKPVSVRAATHRFVCASRSRVLYNGER